MGLTTLFNRDANQQISQLPLGGMPIFLEDIQNLEQAAIAYGISSQLDGWSVILSGCLVSNVNLLTNKLDLTSGYFMIDNIIYYTEGLTDQTFPFSFVPGTQTDDNRIFDDGDSKTVAINYDYGINVSFTYDVSSSYPQELFSDPKQIFFDPFTHQKQEYVLANLSKSVNEAIFVRSAPLVTYTETGNLIVGGQLSLYTSDSLKWRFFGYYIRSGTGYIKSVGTASVVSNVSVGDNLIPVSAIPPLTYGKGTLVTASAGNHDHDFNNLLYPTLGSTSNPNIIIPANSGNGKPLTGINPVNNSVNANSKMLAIADSTDAAGTHIHQITGRTNSGSYYTNDNNSPTGNVQQQYLPKYEGYRVHEWAGYNPAQHYSLLLNVTLPVFTTRPVKFQNM